MRLTNPRILLGGGMFWVLLIGIAAWNISVSNEHPSTVARPNQDLRPTNEKSLGVLRTVRFFGDSVTFGYSNDIAVIGDLLYAIDRFDDKPIAVIHTETGEIRRIGGKGRGPGEFVQPISITRDPVDSAAAWIYDVGLLRLTRVDTKSDRPERFIYVNDLLFHPTFASSRVLVSNGFWSTHLVKTLLLMNERALPSDSMFHADFANVPPAQRSHLNRSAFTLSPDGRRVALGFKYLSRILIGDITGRNALTIDAPQAFIPIYATDPARAEAVKRVMKTRWAYTDITSSDRFVYGLFSGRTTGEAGNEVAFAANIHVVTWDGEFVGTYRLDRYANAIAIDSRTGHLYAAIPLPYPTVVDFGRVE